MRIWVLLGCALVFLVACQQPVACTKDAKQCPDGSYVGRVAPDCEFAKCPTPEPDIPKPDPDDVLCAQDVKECPDGSFVSRIPPSCEFEACPEPVVCPLDVKKCPDGSFVARVGPDCEFEQCPVLEKVDCKPEQRNVDACIEIYQPVCGWFGKNIQCFAYPCAETYSNSCFACDNPDVEYYTLGECPS